MFIPEQEEVLNSSGKNLIVSASAGSGKTTVMIKKVFNHIINRECHVDELLVLTYTKSAANEMKKKLVDLLRQNHDGYDFIQEEIELLPCADICTIDSFCQKLVKKYFYVLNIDPSFSILQGGEEKFQQGVAINRALNEFKRRYSDDYEILLENYSPKRNEDKIKEILFSIHNYLNSVLNIDNFIKKTLNLYKKDEKIAENILFLHYGEIFKDIKLELQKLKNEAESYEFLKYVAYINNLLFYVDNILNQSDFKNYLNALNYISYGILRREKEDDFFFNEKISKEKNRFKLIVDEMIGSFVSAEAVENSYENCGKVICALINLELIFCEEYSSIKRAINCYDFNDVERLMIKLLENEEVRQEIKHSYKYIFVDEFQDANEVQEQIVFSLDDNNMFFVGDTKQSIYAFRQSDPKIFLNIQNKYEQSDSAEAKTLNCNFRTNKNILNFVNFVFNKIMTKGTAGINYEKDSQFVPKANYEDLENEICVSLNIINNNGIDEKKHPVGIYDIKTHKNQSKVINSNDDQCRFICNYIANLIGNPIYDKELGRQRQIDYEDITILILRRGEFLNCLVKHFEELEIPYFVSANSNLEECEDNIILYNLIKLANNSKDDYALYSVLSSELFNFYDEELAEIKLGKEAGNHYFESLENYDGNSDNLLAKIKEFYDCLRRFRYNAKYKGIYFALNEILKEREYFLKISAECDYETRKLNIEQFINYFCSSKYNYDLSGYVYCRENAISSQKIQSENVGLNAVQITTMHSSKGLEYPIVILPNLEANYLKSPGGQDIKINQDVGIGVKSYELNDRVVNNGIFFEVAKLKNKDVELSEKIRLLYVAMTRAKNKLILIGKNSNNYQCLKSDYDIKSCNNFLSLILGAMSCDTIDKINNGEIFTEKLCNNQRVEINSIVIESVNLLGQKKIVIDNKDDTAIQVLENHVLKEMPKHYSIALKNSVSELAMDNNSSINFAPKEFKINEHLSENQSEVGIVYHKILEKLDFGLVKSPDDVKNFININLGEMEQRRIADIPVQNIFSNICLIKEKINKESILLKEQKFVMCLPYNEIMGGDISEKILIQGIIDLVIVNKKEIILIDYKHSKKSNENLIEKYKKQIELYEMALKKRFAGYKISKYILSLNSGTLIDLNWLFWK